MSRAWLAERLGVLPGDGLRVGFDSRGRFSASRYPAEAGMPLYGEPPVVAALPKGSAPATEGKSLPEGNELTWKERHGKGRGGRGLASVRREAARFYGATGPLPVPKAPPIVVANG